MKIAIVGGAGKMGIWLARQLLCEPLEVILVDSHAMRLSVASSELKIVGTTDLKAVANADIVLLALPITTFADNIKELSSILQPSQTVMDITSVKVMTVNAMHKYFPSCLVLGAHPVFGPGAQSWQKQNVILTPTSDEETKFANKIRFWLEERGAHVETMSPAEHDHAMSVVLGLAHFIAIVSGDTLLHQTEMQEMQPLSSVTFRLLMTLVGSVISEDPSLYASIQTHLTELPELEKDFISRAQEWADLVVNKDSTTFAERMAELKPLLSKWAPDSEKSYRNMYRIDQQDQETRPKYPGDNAIVERD